MTKYLFLLSARDLGGNRNLGIIFCFPTRDFYKSKNNEKVRPAGLSSPRRHENRAPSLSSFPLLRLLYSHGLCHLFIECQKLPFYSTAWNALIYSTKVKICR